jgi:hypothetical protein
VVSHAIAGQDLESAIWLPFEFQWFIAFEKSDELFRGDVGLEKIEVPVARLGREFEGNTQQLPNMRVEIRVCRDVARAFCPPPKSPIKPVSQQLVSQPFQG